MHRSFLLFLLVLPVHLLASPPSDDCANEIVYGDPGFANLLEFSFEGKVRRLHFETIEVEQNRGRYDIRIPRIVIGEPERFGWVNAGPASASLSLGAMGGTLQGTPIGVHFVLDPGATFASSQAELRSWVMPTLDCLQDLPGFPSLRDFFEGRRSDFAYIWDKSPWLTFESRLKETNATLRVAIATPVLRRPADAAPGAAAYMDEAAVEARGVVYAGLDVIQVEPVNARNAQGQTPDRRPFTLPLPATGQRLARLVRDGAEVYEYRVLEPGLIVVDQHRITPDAGERDQRRIFDVPVNPLGGPLEALELSGATRVDRFVISRVTHGALPPLRLASDPPVDAPQRPAVLTLDALPSTLPPVRLSRIEPHVLTLTDGRKRVRLAMGSLLVDGRGLLQQVQEWGRMPVPTGAEGQLIEQMGAEAHQALQVFFAEVRDQPLQWATEDEGAAFLSWITPLFVAMGIPTGDLAAIREAEDAFVLMDEHMDESLMALAFDVFEGEQVQGQAEAEAPSPVAFGPTVLMDPATGRPMTRTERLFTDRDDLVLDLEVTYGGPFARLQARNVEQGADELELPLPEGLFDANQVLSLIPFLHLAEDAPQTLYLFDLAAHQRVRYANAVTSYTAHLEPRVSRLTLALDGGGMLPSAGQDIPVLRLRATLIGPLLPPLGQLLVERPALDAQGAQVFELLVRAEAPHHLLRVRVGDQELRAGPEVASAAVDGQ